MALDELRNWIRWRERERVIDSNFCFLFPNDKKIL
jgi:hypothetical protein